MKPKIKDAIDKLNKTFGIGSVVTFNKDSVQKIERFPSGSIGLDIALGGGYPKGRIIEIYGTQSGGKTTLTLHAIAEIHKLGGTAAFIDAEHAFDPTYAKSIGVEVENEEKFIFSQPMTGEEAVEIARELLKTGEVDLIVIDSVSAMIPKAELLGEVGDSKMGLHARLMSQAMRMLTGEINKSKSTVIFINQIREKIGVMFGSPEVTSGGNALKFFASIRLDVRSAGQNKDGEEVISSKTRVKIVKNKTAPPFRQCEFDIVFGHGIDSISEMIEFAVDLAIIKKSGSWYSYEETKIGQGIEKVKDMLRDNPELFEVIVTKLQNKLNE